MIIALHIIGTLLAIAGLQVLWSYVHELSHVLALKRIDPAAVTEIRPYPHRRADGSWVWANTGWTTSRPLSDRELAWISAAPRVPDIAACLALVPCALLLSGHAAYIVVLLLGGGVLNYFVGSLGITHKSDLQRMSRGWNVNAWVLRLVGMVSVTLVTVTVILGLLL